MNDAAKEIQENLSTTEDDHVDNGCSGDATWQRK